MAKRRPQPPSRSYFIFGKARQAPTYSGPLDIVPGAIVAYGQRALSSALRGSAVYTIRRSSDNATQSFNSDATTGDVPSAAIAAFIGGGSGFVSKWNDQGGNGNDLLQATAAHQPSWIADAINNVPSIGFLPLPIILQSSAMPNWGAGAAFTFFGVCKIATSAIQANFGANFTDDNGPDLGFGVFVSGANFNAQAYSDSVNFDNGNSVASADDIPFSAGYIVADISWNGTSASFSVNGTASATIQGQSIGTGVSGSIEQTLFMTGDGTGGTEWLELIGYGSYLTDQQRSDIRANIAAYYGISLS